MKKPIAERSRQKRVRTIQKTRGRESEKKKSKVIRELGKRTERKTDREKKEKE